VTRRPAETPAVAREWGKDWATALFKDFRAHPEYLGPKFTWEGFPAMAGRLCEASAGTHFVSRRWRTLGAIAGAAAVERASELIAETGLVPTTKKERPQ